MTRLRRGVALAFLFTLAATALIAQGARPETPGTTPISGAAAPELVDRNGRVVGTLSADTGVVFTLPDGRKTLLRWSRTALSNAFTLTPPNVYNPSPSPTLILFRSNDCSGPAYVYFPSLGPPGDPMALILQGLGAPPEVGGAPFEGADVPFGPTNNVLYASETGARVRYRQNNFLSYYAGPMYPPCVAGTAPFPPWLITPDGFVPAYLFEPTTVDLNAFEYPFHVKE